MSEADRFDDPEYAEYIRLSGEILSDPMRKDPGRLAAYDQWLSEFDATMPEMMASIREIQGKGLSRLDFVDTHVAATAALLAQGQQPLSDVLASYAATLWKLSKYVYKDKSDG